jgi:hypothetical protein
MSIFDKNPLIMLEHGAAVRGHGTLDNCKCGCEPYYIKENDTYRVYCSKCGLAITPEGCISEAMVQWNKMRRGVE